MGITLTPNLELEKPDYKNKRWDIPLNGNFDKLDSISVAMTSPSLLYNPIFQIWQRGDSFNSPGYFADRWAIRFSASTPTTAKKRVKTTTPISSDVQSPSLAIVGYDGTINPHTSDFSAIEQRVPDLWRFGGRTVTVKIAAAQALTEHPVGVEMAYYDGSALHRSVAPLQYITIKKGATADYFVSFDLPSLSGYNVTSGNYLKVTFWLSAGHSVAGGVGANKGSLWIHEISMVYGRHHKFNITVEPIEKVLRSCLAFYQVVKAKNMVYAGADNYVASTLLFFPMQKAPTPSYVDTGSAGLSVSPKVESISQTGCRYVAKKNSSAGSAIMSTNITFDAEL